MGKSRLAREFLSRHSDRSLGLVARGYPLGATTPFSLWTEALERHLRTLDDQALVRLCGRHGRDLAPLFPSVQAAHPWPPTGVAFRLGVFEALTALVEELGRQRPLVIVFDDMHLADPSSWDALSYMVHNAAAARALFLLGARPGELDQEPVGSEAVLALEQEDLLRRWTLGPLDRTELLQLAQETVPADKAPPSEALLDWLEERSRGTPLFALGLLHGLIDAGGDLSAPQLDAVPKQLSERVVGRLRRLDRCAREVLDLFAVLGRRLEAAEIMQHADCSLDELVPRLEELLQARLISEEESGRAVSYEVIHPLVQETIYQGLSAARRRMLHRQLARGLLSAGRLGEAAEHFARSAGPGDAEAIEALRAAIVEAEAREAYREALAIVAALVEIIPSGDQRWLQVLEALSGEAEWVVDHRADADASTLR